MQELKKQSIKLEGKSACLRDLLLDTRQIVNYKRVADRMYCHNYQAIAFTSDNDMYVSKYSKEKEIKLKELGFIWKAFYVPFSNICVPADENQREIWDSLK